ncbi:MAG: STAS domain-containing protein [archaeon]|nr:STAS domain-containing protein [archaeon]
MLEIKKTKTGNKLVIKLTGRLDTNTAPELNKTIKDDLKDIEELIYNLSELIYISSAGLRVILLTQKIMSKQGSMKIINTQDIVMEVFKATGFTEIIDIE